MKPVTPKIRMTLTATEACTYLGIRWGQWLTQMYAFHTRRRPGTKWMPTPIDGAVFSLKAVFSLDDVRHVAENNTFKVHGPIGTLPDGVAHPVPDISDPNVFAARYGALFNIIKDPDMRQTVWVQILTSNIVDKYARSERTVTFAHYLKAAIYRRYLNQLRGEARARAALVEYDELPDAIDQRQDTEIVVEAHRFSDAVDSLPDVPRWIILHRLLDGGDDDGLHRLLNRAFLTVTARRPVNEHLARWLQTDAPSLVPVKPKQAMTVKPKQKQTLEAWLRTVDLKTIDAAIDYATRRPILAARARTAVRTFLTTGRGFDTQPGVGRKVMRVLRLIAQDNALLAA